MKSFKRLLADWVIHSVLIWLVINIVAIVPFLYRKSVEGNYLFYADGSQVTGWQYFLNHNFYQSDMFIAPVFIFLTELNYRYFLKNKKFGLPLLGLNCLLTGLFSFMLHVLLHPGRSAETVVLAGIEPVLYMGGYAFGYLLIRDYFVQLRYKSELKAQQSESELKALKAQLNPHFLFNSLNYLYGTALQENASRTAEGIDRLSEMLRYVLTGIDKNVVPLSDELKFVENFIGLQQVRLQSKNLIQANIQNRAVQPELEIAPLLLLPFIDNAFKYGISIDRPSPVQIKIDITSSCLNMEISNRLARRSKKVRGNGTGIKNTRKRLELLYADKHRLECKTVGQTYTASLVLELN